MRSPARTMPWSSAIRMCNKGTSLRDVEPDTRSASRGRSDSELATDQARTLGHSRQADAAAFGLRGRVEALPLSRTRNSTPCDGNTRSSKSTKWRRSAGRCSRAPPAPRGRSPSAAPPSRLGYAFVCRTAWMPVCSLKRASWPSIAAIRPRSSSDGRPQLARQPQQLLHRLVHQALQRADLRGQLLRRLFAQRLQAQQDGGERLVHLVVQVAREPPALLLLGAQHQAPGAASLVLDAAKQAAEGDREPLDLLDVRARDDELGGRAGPDRSPRDARSGSRAARSGAAAGSCSRSARAGSRSRSRRSAGAGR